MKDFGKMSDKEFRKAEKKADLELWSRYAIFARSVMGYTLFKGVFAVPKYVVFQKYKNYPRQLEMIAEGKHKIYRKKPNYNFINATWNILEVELALVSRLGIEPPSSNTPCDSSTSTPLQK